MSFGILYLLAFCFGSNFTNEIPYQKKVISPKFFDGRFLQFISNLLALFQLKNASSNNFDLNFHIYAKCFIGLAQD